MVAWHLAGTMNALGVKPRMSVEKLLGETANSPASFRAEMARRAAVRQAKYEHDLEDLLDV